MAFRVSSANYCRLTLLNNVSTAIPVFLFFINSLLLCSFFLIATTPHSPSFSCSLLWPFHFQFLVPHNTCTAVYVSPEGAGLRHTSAAEGSSVSTRSAGFRRRHGRPPRPCPGSPSLATGATGPPIRARCQQSAPSPARPVPHRPPPPLQTACLRRLSCHTDSVRRRLSDLSHLKR